MVSQLFKKLKPKILSEKGTAVMMVITTIAILSIMAAGMSTIIVNEMNMIVQYQNRTRAYYVAQAGIAHALWLINNPSGGSFPIDGSISVSGQAGTYHAEYQNQVLTSEGRVGNVTRRISVRVNTETYSVTWTTKGDFENNASTTGTATTRTNVKVTGTNPLDNADVTLADPIGGTVIAVPIAAGYRHSLALKTDGTLWAWGQNDSGQLGLGSSDNNPHPNPTQVGTDTNWQTIAAGGFAPGSSHTSALKTDGTLWAWGYNDSGQLGLGDTTQRNSPVQVGTDTNWQAIAAGGRHSLALKTDGTLWAWGYGAYGQLGLNDTDNRNIPTKVGTDTNWQAIAAGYWHSLALKTDGTLWAWGNNWWGQLGVGNTIHRFSPTKVGTDTNWQAIATGYWHSLALKTDGTLWAWGQNDGGQLGLGDTAQRNSPVQVGTDTNWQVVAAGHSHTLALRNDSTLWAWGNNGSGQLGLGNFWNQSSPTKVGTDTNWQAIATGGSHTLALRNDSTLWAWGRNAEGQLGLGNMGIRNSPTRIGTATDWGSTFGYPSPGTIGETGVGLRFDAGAGIRPRWLSLDWTGSVSANYRIGFQIRAYDSFGGGSYVNPTGGAGWYEISSGSSGNIPISSNVDPTQTLEIKIRLTSSDGADTPVLSSLTLNYETAPYTLDYSTWRSN